MNILGEIVFWVFVLLTIGSSMVVVFHSRIIYSAFALLFTFFGIAGLYVFLAADFLAASQVLIYVGGILTLIIFGVFMTTKITTLSIPQLTHHRYIALIPIGLVFYALVHMIFKTSWPVNVLDVGPTTQMLGQLLLTKYLVPFELASVLLLAALVGAMRLARMFREAD
ncbi:MAG: NADH-quinone oxidoreductase subunit J [Calditrichaeota bacterium]|jgi:NADH:ubiquinone oxidoreductase subunit 6 (subunit J)|nr:NADH-quinone oxidoreductase subunit J [Calditrichota bacterium]MBT7617560.1 NADH-quinone oxidoreductase subunit J [Calditrichota bacterium]